MISFPLDWRWLSLPAPIVAMFYILRGCIRFFVNISLMATFVRDMNKNHLPHIYKRLGNIERSLISLPCRPNVPDAVEPPICPILDGDHK